MISLPIPLIVIEGADGAGTTTQAKILVDKLEAGAPTLLTRQPSDDPIGRQLRRILTGQDPPLASQAAIQLMFTADRLDHAERVILPAAKEGRIIVSDRYDLSTAIYLAASEPHYRCPVEGCGWTGNSWPIGSMIARYMEKQPAAVHDHEPDDREAQLLRQAFAWNKAAPRPLVTIVLAVAPAVASERRAARGGKEEMFEQAEFQRRVCRLYSEARRTYMRGEAAEADELLTMYSRLPDRVAIVNGSASVEVVAADVERIAVLALNKLNAARVAAKRP